MRRVEVNPAAWPGNSRLEVVERKGLGHPDTVADGIAELASIRYSQFCLREFGAVLHHNLDKVAVLGGHATFDWTGGTYNRPLRVVFGGRISKQFAAIRLPIEEILESAAKEQIALSLRCRDEIPIRFLHETTDSSMYPHWFSPRTLEDLPELVEPRSNDSAYVTATWPRSPIEELALTSERQLLTYKWTGTDIKVLAVRHLESVDVALTVPALAGHFHGPSEYRDAAEVAKQSLLETWKRGFDGHINLTFRALDDVCETPYPTYQDCYVNLSGSALDYGEDGLVGRGNGRQGLIAPASGSGNEVCFGKNPVYQVGKVGGWIADECATRAGGPVRTSLAFRRGARYTAPMLALAEIADATQMDAALQSLSEIGRRPWIDDLVTRERYRVNQS